MKGKDTSRRLRPRGDRKVVNFYISTGLLEEFREKCKEKGASMSEILESLISKWLEEVAG